MEIDRTREVMIQPPSEWNSMCSPMSAQVIFSVLPPKLDPSRDARAVSGKNWPPCTHTTVRRGCSTVIW